MKFRFFYIFLVGLLTSSFVNAQNSATSDDIYSLSTFQFSDVDFEKDTIVYLNGEWDFYWNELVNPDEFTFNENRIKGEVPGFWKNYPNHDFSYTGYVTYRTRVILPDSYPVLALRIGDIHNSYNLFINGKAYQGVGKVGTLKENSVPKWLPQIVILEEVGTELDIVLQVSNYRHRNGGVEHPIELGSYNAISMEKDSTHLADIFLGGALLVLGMFFIGLYFFWKNDKAALFFGLFTVSLSIRVLIVGWRILIEVMPWLPWEIAIRIEYLALFFCVLFFLQFVKNAFINQTNILVVKWISAFYYLAFAVVVFTPASIFSYFIFPNNILMLGLIVYALVVYIKALRARVFGAGWAVFSFVLFIVAVGMALLDYANLFHLNPILISVGFISFVFSMSLIFAARFGKAFYEVEVLKEKAEKQNELILEKTEEISAQHDLIKDSIHYARRIQQALLPDLKEVNEKLQEIFVYYQPQNLVSGDFYWYRFLEERNEVILVVADCTGHGVPGAFMSIVGMDSLDKIIAKDSSARPSFILQELNAEIREKLNVSNEEFGVQDGMDIIVCRINLNDLEISFASALHKLILLRDNEVKLYSGSKHFIGNEIRKGFEFEEHTISLKSNDQLFMFSDGIYDQKGGEKGKKLYYKGFEEYLIEISQLPFSHQQQALHSKIQKWKGTNEQIDDMLVFSWKLK